MEVRMSREGKLAKIVGFVGEATGGEQKREKQCKEGEVRGGELWEGKYAKEGVVGNRHI